jgi:hypothetical protein
MPGLLLKKGLKLVVDSYRFKSNLWEPRPRGDYVQDERYAAGAGMRWSGSVSFAQANKIASQIAQATFSSGSRSHLVLVLYRDVPVLCGFEWRALFYAVRC